MPDYGFGTTTVAPPSNLLAGHFPQVGAEITIARGARTLTAGTVMGRITTGGKWTACDPEAEDGSETPRAILAEDVTITAGADAVSSAWLTGQYRADALTGYVASMWDALRALSIFVH